MLLRMRVRTPLASRADVGGAMAESKHEVWRSLEESLG